MAHLRRILILSLPFLAIACSSGTTTSSKVGNGDPSKSSGQTLLVGSSEQPLRVMLIPADGGTEAGTLADFEPVFAAITRQYGIHFHLRVGQAYNAVVEGMANGKVDLAFFGPVTYHQAKQRGAAELLAVGVNKGESVYYSGIFVNKDSNIKELKDLRGRRVAFGDVNSTSSFNFPLAMILNAGLDPVKDLGEIYLTGSHSNALAALAAGKVDAACSSYISYARAVENGYVDPAKTIPLAKSEPIPYPPLAMHKKLNDELKKKLRDAFNHVHEAEGVTAEMMRGYGGKRVDRYDANFPESEFDMAMSKLAKITDELKAEILRKAAETGL